MMTGLFQKFQEAKWKYTLLFLVMATGIFFRTYQHHDWLRFNADQSRDASVVSSYLAGEEALPLLGPKAGGTNFRVGAAFYYFQIAAAKLFGNTPDRMAYPDLFFSILSLPLLFLFLRKYFDGKTALALTAIFAVSFYAVKYSRFAWNPNSLPFWSLLFLYGLHEIMLVEGTAWKRWSVITGVAFGVGVQFHTMSLILFPILALGVFLFLLARQKEHIWKTFFIISFLALLLNAPLLLSEIRTGGENTAAFFESIGAKEKKGSGFLKNTLKDVVCFSEASTYILSGYESSDTCEMKSATQGWNRLAFLFGLVVFVGGFVLAARSFWYESEPARRYFLGIFITYSLLSFLLFLPLANEISMRFFLVIVFMPFVLLGLWSEYLRTLLPRAGLIGIWALGSVLMISNIVFVGRSFADYQAYLSDSEAGMDNVLLEEVERSAAFVIAQAGDAKTVAVTGDAKYLFKALKSMRYFTESAGIKLVQKSKKTDPSLPVFLVENTKQKDEILTERPDIKEYLVFGRFTIFFLPPN